MVGKPVCTRPMFLFMSDRELPHLFFLGFIYFQGYSLVKYAENRFLLQTLVQSSSPLLANY